MSPTQVIAFIKTTLSMSVNGNKAISMEELLGRKPLVMSMLQTLNPFGELPDSTTFDRWYEIAMKEFMSVNPVSIDPSSSLVKPNQKTWLTEERKAQMPSDYIDRYLAYLGKNGRSKKVVEEIRRSSEAILGKLADPQSQHPVYIKGLVVGSVQSGKTGNFNAVINRAVDAGYNLIIILSGIMEDLRVQTQMRVDKEVIGEGITDLSSEKIVSIGVGLEYKFGVNSADKIPQVIGITSHRSDFKRTIQDANFSLNHKNILVCKKNTSVLTNLLVWLHDYLAANKEQHDIPLLIIDDEADNASLNNLGYKGREYASKINGHIRAILGLFSRKTYLGYTGTPFANVLQDRNEQAIAKWEVPVKRNNEQSKSFKQVSNIFPDDFIELLDTPSNYIGAKQIFETFSDPDRIQIPLTETVDDEWEAFPGKLFDDGEQMRPATDSEIEYGKFIRSPYMNDPFPTFLPQSLIDATGCFVLGIAVRLKRKAAMSVSALYNPHNTMLIHISRFSEWQNRTRDLIKNLVDQLSNRINTELPGSPDSVYGWLEALWNRYFESIIQNIRTYLPGGYTDEFLTPVSFEEIKSLLPEAIRNIEIKAINSVTGEKLAFPIDASGNGKKYIAVGGNRLSRGFTLEGLTINYFIRDTNFADTLLQMGRWFGYRPGYIDCCKLFTTSDSIEKFNAVTRTIEELELEFKRMEQEGKSPEDFILRVRTHPDVLRITRPSILRNTIEVNWSYRGRLAQTTQFSMQKDRIIGAWDFLKGHFRENPWKFWDDRNFYILDTDTKGLFELLDAPNAFHNFHEERELIRNFINLATEQGMLKRWRIAVKAGGSSKKVFKPELTGLEEGKIQLTVRSGPSKESDYYYKRLLDKKVFVGSGKSANIVTAGKDMALWLDDAEIAAAEAKFVEEKEKELNGSGKSADKINKPERIYRERMKEETGLLVIYLMDLEEIFRTSDAKNKFNSLVEISSEVPLIGYALGFPKDMSVEIGGRYVQGIYNINEEDEPQTEEPDNDVLQEN